MKKMSFEAMCRIVLAKAVREGLLLVRQGAKAPEDLCDSELFGVADLLGGLVLTWSESSDQAEAVDDRAKYIVRTATVKVNRSLTPEDVFDATGRKQYVKGAVRDAMPRMEGEVATLHYFKPRPEAYDKNGWLSLAALDAEYAYHGLVADPAAQAADNATSPEMADIMPNACQWTEGSGKHCYAAFDRWYGERRVGVLCRSDDGWLGHWSFAGVRKKPSAT